MSNWPLRDWDPVKGLADALTVIDTKDGQINAFVALADRGALAQLAEQATARRDRGQVRSPIDGVVVGLKDNIDTADMPTALGSAMYKDRRPAVDAPVAARLRAAGALLIGKTNLTELACGTEGVNEYFGNVTNPSAPERFPGGSSSGSAAAVAANMVPLAVGSDTSCSIRNPAASCGTVGLKPTFDRVPTAGVGVCSKRLDHVGPMSRDCAEAAALLAVLQDPHWPDPLASFDQPLNRLNIGILTGPFVHGCDPAVSATLERAEQIVGAICGSVSEVDIGVDLAEADEHVNVLCRDMFELYGSDVLSASSWLVGKETRYWFEFYRAQSDGRYVEAIQYQQAIRDRITQWFSNFDVLICPTIRSLPALVGGAESDRSDRAENCSLWSLAGTPSLSIPGPVAQGAVPVGILLNGGHGDDGRILALGAAIQAASDQP